MSINIVILTAVVVDVVVRAAHNNIVILLVVFTSYNIFIAISVVRNILRCNILGHQYIHYNICHYQYICCIFF
jgi:hypothetical protein